MFTLVINPGSTSTKVAVYEDNTELHKKTLTHSKEELSQFDTILDQFDFRHNLIQGFLDEVGFAPSKLNCIISRGGSPPDVRSGATAINDELVKALRERPKEPHPACVGPLIAYKMAGELGIPSFIYDPVTADELNDLARVFGVKGIENDSMCHVLNTRAMSIAVSKELGKPFNEMTFIVAHFGGGNSLACWHKGLLHDCVQGDACAFSAERCGHMRAERVIALTKEYGADHVIKWYHGKGGMASLMGTNDLRVVEDLAAKGDKQALLYQQAMAYQLSKCISSLFPSVKGAVDGVILTGGGAYWKLLVADVQERLAFLNTPIYVRPGENEMLSLAEGAYRVMNNEEAVHAYTGEPLRIPR